jgi:hypothetical protein
MATTTVPYAEFLGSNDPIPVLESTARRITEITTGLTPGQIGAPPAPGKWSIHQIVAHIADTELVALVRFRMMLFEDAPTLVAYDQDRWLNGWMREEEPFAGVLDRFRVIRASTVRLLRAAPANDLKRSGTHTERGVVTVNDYIVTIAGHDINHLNQIEGIRTKFKTGA